MIQNANFSFDDVGVISVQLHEAPIVVTSDEVDARLAPFYERTEGKPGLLESLAGIRERRQWPDGVSFTEEDTYTDQAAPLSSPDIVHFNHGLAEIFNALWSAGMEITMFDEHDTVPWNPLGPVMEEVAGGEFRLTEAPERMPMSYTLRAR